MTAIVCIFHYSFDGVINYTNLFLEKNWLANNNNLFEFRLLYRSNMGLHIIAIGITTANVDLIFIFFANLDCIGIIPKTQIKLNTFGIYLKQNS